MPNTFRVGIIVWDFTNREFAIDAEFNVDTESAFDALIAAVGQITGEDDLKPLSGCHDSTGLNGNGQSPLVAHPGTQPSPYSAKGH